MLEDILKPLVLFFVSPLHLVMMALFVGAICHVAGRTAVARRCYLCALSVLVLFSQPYMATLLLYPLEHTYAIPSDERIARADVLYVPACYYTTVGSMTEVARFHECSLQRLTQAAIFYHHYQVPIMLTGGNFLMDKNIAFAETSSRLLTTLGVPTDHIVIVNQGTNTQEEVLAIGRHISDKRIIAISSATHQHRVTALLSDFSDDVAFYPVDYLTPGSLTPFIDWPSAIALEKSKRALYEYGARIKFWLYTSDKPLSGRWTENKPATLEQDSAGITK